MTPTIEQLQQEAQYVQLEVLPYSEMIAFVQRQYQKPTRITRFYIGLNIFLLIVIITLAILHISSGNIRFWQLLYAIFLGFAAALTILIPVHEAIHGLAYKMVGAPKVSYGGSWRQFYFYAVADRFVVGSKAFRLVALAPFVVISLIAIIILSFSSIFTQYIMWGILFMHTGACAGDFGMLGYYERYGKNGEIFTFDEVEAQRAYFFQKQNSQNQNFQN